MDVFVSKEKTSTHSGHERIKHADSKGSPARERLRQIQLCVRVVVVILIQELHVAVIHELCDTKFNTDCNERVSMKVRLGLLKLTAKCYDTFAHYGVKVVRAFFRELTAKEHYGPITIPATFMTSRFTCNSDFGSVIVR